MNTKPYRVPDADQRVADLAFAGRAAIYLEKQGLDEEAVVRCLMDEFDLDRKTAIALAGLAA